MSKKLYFIAMSQKDLFKNEVLEEILRERKTFYTAKNQEIDFWILIAPNFLNSTILKENTLETNYYRQLNLKLDADPIESFGCIISMNKEFLDWIKLRLGFFDNITQDKKIRNINNSNNLYQSNGISGEFEYSSENNSNFLDNNSYNLNNSFLLNKFSKVFQNLKTNY